MAEVDFYESLCNLRILEQFKSSVPDLISIYISEQKVKTAGEADDYVLSQGGDNGQLGAVRSRTISCAGGTVRHMIVEQRICHSDKFCHYCHKRGYVKNDCYTLKA